VLCRSDQAWPPALCDARTRNVAKEESLKPTRDELYAKLRSIVDTYNLNYWEAERQKQLKGQKQ
jgi:hypothetical protein